MKTKKKAKKHAHSSSSSSSSDSDSDSREKKRLQKKEKKRLRKEKKKRRREERKLKKMKKELKKELEKTAMESESQESPQETPSVTPAEADPLERDAQDAIKAQRKAMAPMTKEEWEKQQSVMRRVFDPESGRTRLIKGDGEIMEEIVSRDRQREINRQATLGDGAFFQAQLKSQMKKT